MSETEVSYEIVTEDGHVVLRLPENGLDLLFDPATALAFGVSFQAAATDLGATPRLGAVERAGPLAEAAD